MGDRTSALVAFACLLVAVAGCATPSMKQNAYNEGYRSGYSEGRAEGRADGWDESYGPARKKAYRERAGQLIEAGRAVYHPGWLTVTILLALVAGFAAQYWLWRKLRTSSVLNDLDRFLLGSDASSLDLDALRDDGARQRLFGQIEERLQGVAQRAEAEGSEASR